MKSLCGDLTISVDVLSIVFFSKLLFYLFYVVLGMISSFNIYIVVFVYLGGTNVFSNFDN